ncbi:MAG: Ppx/GppA phosphatase family protein [Alphaproteobacteria bacterium]
MTGRTRRFSQLSRRCDPAIRDSDGRNPEQAVYAALDLGTNNCRLLVVQPQDGGFRVLDAFSRIVRLGSDLARNGCLHEAAMARTLAALRVCAGKIHHHRATQARCVATAACRQAGNGTVFLNRVQAETGLVIETITPRQEAAYGLAGCLPLFEADKPFGLIFDIGGGSTELTWFRFQAGGRPEIVDSLSVPLGVVNLANRFGDGAAEAADSAALVEEFAVALSGFDRRNGIAGQVALGRVSMVGTSGTVTTLCGIHLDLPRYHRQAVDGCRLSFDQLAAAAVRVSSLDLAGRVAHPCIGPGRADLVVPGCAILDAICRQWPVGTLAVADRGLREGMLLDMMARTGDLPARVAAAVMAAVDETVTAVRAQSP